MSLAAPASGIVTIEQLDNRLEPWRWTWAEANAASIARNWERLLEKKPKLFDGKVLLARDVWISEGRMRARYFEVNYSQFLSWRDFDHPDQSIWNGFAMAALRGSNGFYVCGVMGPHTANAGQVYFPAGTPDRADCRADGTVDLAGSVLRELKEETGLTNGFTANSSWQIVRCWPALAHLRILQFADPAELVAQRIEAFLATQDEPELSGTRIVRRQADIDPTTMPPFLQLFFKETLPKEPLPE